MKMKNTREKNTHTPCRRGTHKWTAFSVPRRHESGGGISRVNTSPDVSTTSTASVAACPCEWPRACHQPRPRPGPRPCPRRPRLASAASAAHLRLSQSWPGARCPLCRAESLCAPAGKIRMIRIWSSIVISMQSTSRMVVKNSPHSSKPCDETTQRWVETSKHDSSDSHILAVLVPRRPVTSHSFSSSY